MHREYKKITENVNDWKNTKWQTTNTVGRPSQEGYRKKRVILGEGRRKAGM
jgi:hypothetical protein